MSDAYEHKCSCCQTGFTIEVYTTDHQADENPSEVTQVQMFTDQVTCSSFIHLRFSRVHCLPYAGRSVDNLIKHTITLSKLVDLPGFEC